VVWFKGGCDRGFVMWCCFGGLVWWWCYCMVWWCGVLVYLFEGLKLRFKCDEL
jgi:hypothetical protein